MSGTHILSTTISLDASSSTSGVETVTVTRSSHIVGAAIIIGFIIILLCIVLILVKLVSFVQHLSRTRRRSAFAIKNTDGRKGSRTKGGKWRRNALDVDEWEGTRS